MCLVCEVVKLVLRASKEGEIGAFSSEGERYDTSDTLSSLAPAKSRKQCGNTIEAPVIKTLRSLSDILLCLRESRLSAWSSIFKQRTQYQDLVRLGEV